LTSWKREFILRGQVFQNSTELREIQLMWCGNAEAWLPDNPDYITYFKANCFLELQAKVE